MNKSSLSFLFATLVIASAHCRGQGTFGGKENGLNPSGDSRMPRVVAAADPVIKAGANVSLTGKLRGGVMAIGGETTGWQLTYNTPKGAASIDVDMSAIKDAKAEDNAEVTITGEVVAKEYVERGRVLILKAVTVAKAGSPTKKQ